MNLISLKFAWILGLLITITRPGICDAVYGNKTGVTTVSPSSLWNSTQTAVQGNLIKQTSRQGGNVLYLGALAPKTNHHWARYARSLVIMIERALEEINNRTDILPDYQLKLLAYDTEVS